MGGSVDLHTSTFRVYGTPVPQGGMRYVPTPGGSRQITVGGVGLQDWRSSVAAEAAVQVVEGSKHRGPVALYVDFRYPMPGTRKAAQRRHGSMPRTSRPDIDKLLRAVCDAITVGGLWLDDAQVAELHCTKYEFMDSWQGIDVAVRDLWTP